MTGPEREGGGEADGVALLRLLQLHDSQFPVGAFAHSNGIETYAQAGMTPGELRDHLAMQLELGWGRLDLAAWSLAFRDPCPEALDELASGVTAWKPIPGLRSSSLRLGRRTVKLVARLWPAFEDLTSLAEPHQAVVAGAIARRSGFRERDGLLAFAQATLSASLAAATRCMPLAPERAQEITVELQPALIDAVERVLADPSAQLWSATPGADLAAHRQAFLPTRLFQS